MNRLTAQDIINIFKLEKLPGEGGFFRQTWQSRIALEVSTGNQQQSAVRSLGTAIYYLITPEEFSSLHLVASDELWHFYAGDPLQQLALFTDGKGTITQIGNDFALGQVPQTIVPAGTWQGTRLISGGQWALVGTTVCPGFVYQDYQQGTLELLQAYPEYTHLISELTAR